MVALIAVVVAFVLFVVTGHTWADYCQRSQQLRKAILDCEGQIDEHVERLAQVRARQEEAREQSEVAVREGNDVGHAVAEMRDELSRLEARLAPLRPKPRGGAMGDRGGDSLWQTP